MSRTVEDYIAFLTNVIDALPRQVEGILKRNEAEILDLNRQKQLYERGEDSENDLLAPYKPFTVEIKQLIGQPFDRTTLFYSGSLYKSFKMQFDPESMTLTILATDEKVPKLVLKYGEDIFGLTDENENIVNQRILKPELIKFIQQYL